MIDVLIIAHLRIAPQEGNYEVGNCEVHLEIYTRRSIQKALFIFKIYFFLLYLSHIKVFESCS